MSNISVLFQKFTSFEYMYIFTLIRGWSFSIGLVVTTDIMGDVAVSGPL